MYSLRPHRQFNFVRLWKPGFIFSGILIALSIVGLVLSLVTTGSALTLGTEFSGGTSIQIHETGDITEEQITEAFNTAASDLSLDTQISSVQSSTDMNGNAGFIVKTTDTDSNVTGEIMASVEESLGIDASNAEIETMSPSWGTSVIWSSIVAFFLSCVGILLVISLRYREPRMGVVALVTLFHDMFIVLGIYAWAGMYFHMEITSDVIAALLAIIGYSLYDTIVVFHRINKNASPQMKCSLKTCANRSLNEIIVRSLNTSITSVIPVVLMLILGSDTLLDFAFAMFCGMVIGVYSTLAISAPLYTFWKCRQPDYARLEKKYPYEVVQSTFTKEMQIAARKDYKVKKKEAKQERAQEIKEQKELERKQKDEARAEKKSEGHKPADEEAGASPVKDAAAEAGAGAGAEADVETDVEAAKATAEDAETDVDDAKTLAEATAETADDVAEEIAADTAAEDGADDKF